MDVDIGELMVILIVDITLILQVNWHSMEDIMVMMVSVSIQLCPLKSDFKEWYLIVSKLYVKIML